MNPLSEHNINITLRSKPRSTKTPARSRHSDIQPPQTVITKPKAGRKPKNQPTTPILSVPIQADTFTTPSSTTHDDTFEDSPPDYIHSTSHLEVVEEEGSGDEEVVEVVEVKKAGGKGAKVQTAKQIQNLAHQRALRQRRAQKLERLENDQAILLEIIEALREGNTKAYVILIKPEDDRAGYVSGARAAAEYLHQVDDDAGKRLKEVLKP